MSKSKGKTKSVGYQFGIRKTFTVNLEDAWEFMFSKKGLNIWLGDNQSEQFDLNTKYKTINGIEGTVRVFKIHSHVRMSYNKPEWENSSTLQIRFIPLKNKTTISFHLEKIKDSEQRVEVEKEWKFVITKLKNAFDEL